MSEPRFDYSNGKYGPQQLSAWWGVHAARYEFALPYVNGARVLDIACGTGYGMKILAQRARAVIGVDLDEPASQKASAVMHGVPGGVLMADGCRLPFPDAAFDVVTSFETLEHLHQRGAFVRELRRVLRPGGRCILSTPNANYTRPANGKPKNPYHVFEYTPEELQAEIAARFSIAQMVGQVLDPRFRISPFQDDQDRLPRDPVTQARRFVWRVVFKFPVGLREQASRVLWKRPFFPDEHDYHFEAAAVQTAPVLVVIGR